MARFGKFFYMTKMCLVLIFYNGNMQLYHILVHFSGAIRIIIACLYILLEIDIFMAFR